MIEWSYVKPHNTELLKLFEKETGVVFPDEFKQMLPKIEGGFPSDDCFIVVDHDNGEEATTHHLERIFTFNNTRRGNIWSKKCYIARKSNGTFIPFAEDTEGNPLGFLNCGASSPMRVELYIRKEHRYVTVAGSFYEFLLGLYSEEKDTVEKNKIPYPYNLIMEIDKVYEEKNDSQLRADAVELVPSAVDKLLDTLPNRKYTDIMLKRYKEHLTLFEIAQIYNVTREYVRQVIERVLDKISNKDYLEYFVVSNRSEAKEKSNRFENNETLLEELEYIKCALDGTSKTIASLQTKFDVVQKRITGTFDNSDTLCGVYSHKLNNTELSTRTVNALARIGVFTIGDVVSKLNNRRKLFEIRNFGKYCEADLTRYLQKYNIIIPWNE